MPVTAARAAAAARTRLNQALTKHLVADFAEHGAEVIAKLRKEKPVDYIKLVSALLQKENAADAALTATYNVVERRIIRPDDLAETAKTVPSSE